MSTAYSTPTSWPPDSLTTDIPKRRGGDGEAERETTEGASRPSRRPEMSAAALTSGKSNRHSADFSRTYISAAVRLHAAHYLHFRCFQDLRQRLFRPEEDRPR